MRVFNFILWLLVLAFFAGMATVPHIVAIHNQADKMLHVTVFCFMALWPALTYSRPRHIYWTAGFLLLIGAGMELAQAFTPPRQMSMEDMAANIIGVLCGLFIGYLIRSDYRKITGQSPILVKF